MKRIFVRTDLCTACKTCELACAVEHSQARSIFASPFERPIPMHRLFVEAADGHKVPVLCRQCEDAPCAAACISGALFHDPQTGTVLCDWSRCIGCWTCVMVCPYGVIGRQLELGKAVKCDLCVGRDVPACVSACPTKALSFEEVDQFSKDKRLAFAAAVAGG
ncbi:MAG TPA: 4Fe-4S dicluster domain-containing protein [Anaerolineales bacterium]|nr:4Fe-4S dicluster domain-containing protein [Anaerolineales bacterium]